MKGNEEERLILLLVKQDFPNMGGCELANISPHQRRGYLAQVTRFLKLAELFGYKVDVNRDNKLDGDIDE